MGSDKGEGKGSLMQSTRCGVTTRTEIGQSEARAGFKRRYERGDRKRGIMRSRGRGIEGVGVGGRGMRERTCFLVFYDI